MLPAKVTQRGCVIVHLENDKKKQILLLALAKHIVFHRT